MALPGSIQENLHFLLAECAAHLALLKEDLKLPSASIPRRLLDRQGYVENLRLTIDNRCFKGMTTGGERDSDRQLHRSVTTVASHLERICELCRDAVQQRTHLRKPDLLKVKDYMRMLDRVDDGLGLIAPALMRKDTRLALKIGKLERRLDRDYQRHLKQAVSALKRGKHHADRITLILLAQRIEQMGDALLCISEAIISAAMGQHFNTDRYHAFSESIDELQAVNDNGLLQVEKIAETRSGSSVAGIGGQAGGNGFHAILKDGRKRKLKEERQRVNDWHEIIPGLAPKILSYRKHGDSAALLIEHLAGETFEQILLHGSDELLQQALNRLTLTLDRVWQETRSEKPVSAGYMKQLAKRMEDVYAIHPEFHQAPSRIGSLRLASFDQLLAGLSDFESSQKAPFSVYIHGDFNLDNIIYDAGEGRINFIDLHRSRYMDYLQDVSVFMVSSYRLQVFDPRSRRRILDVCRAFYRFARGFARKSGDEGFEVRLALGLVRSFASSTRYILDPSLSWSMFTRATYLMERLLEAEAAGKRFRLAVEEIFVG